MKQIFAFSGGETQSFHLLLLYLSQRFVSADDSPSSVCSGAVNLKNDNADVHGGISIMRGYGGKNDTVGGTMTA